MMNQTCIFSADNSSGFNFDNSYARLTPGLYKKQRPVSVKKPSLLIFNRPLARSLGLNIEHFENEGAEFLSGNSVYLSSEPIAQAYAGHQFGGFNILGDGRAILLGEHITSSHKRFDIQLKGSGRTPYSRSGDGRAALGPMLREYIISEAMHALGIPTTRSLAVVTTGELVYRDDAYPGAILTRVASSHIRVGTFQYAAATQDHATLLELTNYTINRHFPEIATSEDRYIQLLEKVIDLQAQLISQWMQVGFIHGVMNTDNMSICGETIDYGPCAFMNTYNPTTVFSSIDSNGRYAFINQPPIAHWNLCRFAETLLPLIHPDEDRAISAAEALLKEFPTKFLNYWLDGMRKKIGLCNNEPDDLKLIEDLLMLMHKNKADFTNTFRQLGKDAIKNLSIHEDAEFRDWMKKWEARLSRQAEPIKESLKLMDQTNPAIIPRNHLVENALKAAVNQDDLTPFKTLLIAVTNPYEPNEIATEFMLAPKPAFDTNYKTFCGT